MGGGSSCLRQRNLLFLSKFEALEFFILKFCSGGSVLAFIGCRTGGRFEYLSSANMSGELSQSSGEPILAFIGCKTGDRFEYLSSANMSGALSQSLGEPILAFIGCKTGGKPNR